MLFVKSCLILVHVMFFYTEGGKHLEIGSDASKQSGDGNIIDVTSEFFASQDIINLATCVDGSSDAESCSGFETIPDAASAQQVIVVVHVYKHLIVL